MSQEGKEFDCSICGKHYVYFRKSGHTTTKCNSCQSNLRRFKLKKDLVAYKGGKCEICGYNKSMRALSFHHINPEEKEFTFSGRHCKSFKKLKLEAYKCVLVCANCHMEIHEKIK